MLIGGNIARLSYVARLNHQVLKKNYFYTFLSSMNS